MQASSQASGGNMIVLIGLGLIEAAIAVLALTNIQLPVISNPRIALIAFFVIGMAMCTMGMEIPRYGWTSPFQIVGIVIGVVIFAITALAFVGVKLPFIADERAAILAMTGLMILKFIVAGIRAVVS